MIHIGSHRLNGQAVLAPMAGVTDLPFRRLCRQFGAALTVSEMIHSDSQLWDSRKTRLRLSHDEDEWPRSVQIAGNDPAMMADAARRNEALGADIIDINMGCPAKKVCRKAAGSALLREPGLVQQILTAVVDSVSVPVTLKIRTGWSPQQRNGIDIAKMAQDCGIAALAVHGRTRECRFNGSAEYDTIAAIVEAIDIPVFANGDICSAEQARRVLDYTAAAGVMIGRGAQGRPWIFREINALLDGEADWAASEALKRQTMLAHLTSLHAFYGDRQGSRIARKHIGWYLGDDARNFRRHFNQLETPGEQTEALHRYLSVGTEYQKEELAA